MVPATRPPQPAGDPEILDDRPASQSSTRISRRAILFVATGVAAYLAALVWNIPASVALSRPAGIASLGGTLWRGRAILVDGESLEWRWAPLRSLVSLGFAADWAVSGPGTDLAGRALFGWDDTTIDTVSGSATGSLLAAALPGLPFLCGMPLQVSIDRVRIGGGDAALLGEVRSDAGMCAPKTGGAATAVPPLHLNLARLGNGSEILLAPLAQRRRILSQGALDRDGHLKLTVTPEGARALPFLAPPGGMAIETTF